MKDFERKGFSQYGASMGRRSDRLPESLHAKARMRLVRVHLDSGGYDKGGAYWGRDLPLWLASWDDESEYGDYYLRARDREAAKAKIAETCKGVKFYR